MFISVFHFNIIIHYNNMILMGKVKRENDLKKKKNTILY